MKKTKIKFNVRRLEFSLLAGLLIAAVLSVANFSAVSAAVRGEILRLHVIANSDSEADQALKLRVRDAVLEEGREIFENARTSAQALKALASQKERLLSAARRAVAENGFGYGVQVEIGEDFFSTRTYDESFTLPAGHYEAVRVILGEGKGQNWWCVMFPPLCLPAAAGSRAAAAEALLPGRELELVKRRPKYEPRFKIIEIYEKIANKFK